VDGIERYDWVVPWAMWVWGALFAAMVVFELYTLWWNKRNPGKRANLSAYVSAYFRSGERRLKYSAGSAVLIALFMFFLLHFLGYV
jgi:hypothetical protein